MAARLTTRKSGGEKPTVKKAPAKKKAAANGPTASADAQPSYKATPRSRKGTSVNAETAKLLRDAEAGKNLLHYPSLEAMFEDLGI